jgi:acetyl-CoA C-acetyltransferase
MSSQFRAIVERVGIDPSEVDQVVVGCVDQVGEQCYNIGRTAWLIAGLPLSVAVSTVDTQCGSSQHAVNLAAALIASGSADVVVAGGVESMTRVPLGSNGKKELELGRPIPNSYRRKYEPTSQFEGAERIADLWKIDRDEADRFALRSQQLAAESWVEGRFEGQIAPVEIPVLDELGEITHETTSFSKDEGFRLTTLEGLAGLKPVARAEGVHTAGNSSQISDGAAAVLLMSGRKAQELGVPVRAHITETCLVGVDPVLMLTGPIDATRFILQRSGYRIDDIDLFEINEAFASVVLAWQRETEPDPDRVNVNGGAIALGHPLGGTGAILVTKALNELERRGGRRALVSMCCGGGLGTGTLIER